MLVTRRLLEGRRPVLITSPRCASRSLEEGLAPHGFRRVGARHAPHPTCRPRLDPRDFGDHVMVTVRGHHAQVRSWFGFCLVEDRRPGVPRTFEPWLETFFAGQSGAEPYVDIAGRSLFRAWTRWADELVPVGCLSHRLGQLLGSVTPIVLPRIRHEYELPPAERLYTPATYRQVAEYFADEIAELGEL